MSYEQNTFLTLLRAGLWERDVRLCEKAYLNFDDVYKIAAEQSVVGLIAAGIEHIIDGKVSQKLTLSIVGDALMIERRNMEMNIFIKSLVEILRKGGVHFFLVKGQGIAQCYERPLWRANGDVDLLLSEEDYKNALTILAPLAVKVEDEDVYKQHVALTIEQWEIELHGTMHCGLWKGLDRVLDESQKTLFCGGDFRIWMNGGIQVFLPGVNEDILFVFSHILQHFYHEGIGLRQICDWCRLLWTYRGAINVELLRDRLNRMGIMSEWLSFAALAVDFLDVPREVIPLYSPYEKWRRKARRIMEFIFSTGNFGHKRDFSYRLRYPFLVYKIISFWRHTKDGFFYFSIFPISSIKVWWRMVFVGLKVMIKK